MRENRLVKLLLIEDDEDDYILALDYLQEMPDYDFDVTWLSDFDEIIQSLQQSVFDLCLLDYQLGAHTGLSVLQAAKKMGVTTPFLMLTGQADAILDSQALTLGAEDFLVKSEINSVRFIRAIRYALARKELANERIERLKVEADSRAKDRFLAHLSHELRTPLTSIMGYTSILLDRTELDDIKPELSIINNNSQHLLTLLNDVLDLSKIQANTLSLSKSWVSLAPFLCDLQNLFKITATKKNLEFSFVATTEVPEQIFCDETRLRQVLINIIYNAIKFTDSGYIKVCVSYESNSELHFIVIDTGIGIPKSKQAHIFKPFEQVQDTTTRSDEGAGLGLAISSALISLMGRGLQVESEPDVGSRFSFYVNISDDQIQTPLNLVKLNLLQPISAPSNIQKRHLSGHVLVVEDIAEIRSLIADLVHATGVEVSCAENGKEAVALLANSHNFDMVLMDLHMPCMDGRDAIVAIRKLGVNVPIIALTAAAIKGSKETLNALGFNDTLTKPIDIVKLHACLSHFLDKARYSEQTSLLPAAPKYNIARILLVEDDKDARELMTLLLESLGITVHSASNISSCMELIGREQRIDLILLDLQLPDGTGFEAASKIRALKPEQDIVIVSGTSPEPELLAQYNVNKVLLKPVSLLDLQQLIEA